jgi:hypothetical protein
MTRKISRAMQIYRWSAFLALPGALWTAFEMYGLTLMGAQMLFFSIMHGMPYMVLMILFSSIFYAAWFLQSVAALAFAKYRDKLGIPVTESAYFATALATHAALLIWYEEWSYYDASRIATCLFGIVLYATTVFLVARYFRNSRTIVAPAEH